MCSRCAIRASRSIGRNVPTHVDTHTRVLGTLSANAGQHLFGVAREQEVLGEVGQPIGVRLLERARIAARQGRRRRVGFLALAVTVGASVRFPFVARAGVFVRLHVCLQVAGKRERFVADFTNVWFITCEPKRTRERKVERERKKKEENFNNEKKYHAEDLPHLQLKRKRFNRPDIRYNCARRPSSPSHAQSRNHSVRQREQQA